MTAVGSKIGQYRLVRRIGAGGMGSVFVGEHILLGRRAAIKTLLPALSQQREIVERFFNEARATSAISDPGVVQVFDFGYHVDGTAYIVMELLEGESLATRLERLGKLAPSQALRIIRQVAGALAAAHANDIIHRDLKPENIFLIRDAEAAGGERAKILDFGICKIGASDASLTQTGATLGTPVYMSPEQCQGRGNIDRRADIYSLGCVLFQALTGRPPFLCEGSGEFIVAHMQQEPPAPSSVLAELPAAIDALVLRCLAKSPDERFPSMIELQAAIEEITPQLDTTTPAGATPMTPPPRLLLGTGFKSAYDGNLSVKISHWFIKSNPTTLRSAAGQTEDLPPPRPSRKSLFAILVAAATFTAVLTTLARSYDDDGVPFDTSILAAPVAPPAIEPPKPDVAVVAPPVEQPVQQAVAQPDPPPEKLEPVAKTVEPQVKKPATKRPVRRVVRRPVHRPAPPPTPTEDLYDSR